MIPVKTTSRISSWRSYYFDRTNPAVCEDLLCGFHEFVHGVVAVGEESGFELGQGPLLGLPEQVGTGVGDGQRPFRGQQGEQITYTLVEYRRAKRERRRKRLDRLVEIATRRSSCQTEKEYCLSRNAGRVYAKILWLADVGNRAGE